MHLTRYLEAIQRQACAKWVCCKPALKLLSQTSYMAGNAQVWS